jgi:predicted amidophosphoribosyltransferase
MKRDTYVLKSRLVLIELMDKLFSVRALAEEVGCGKSMIQHLRAGTRTTCSRALAEAIEDALGLPVRGMLFVPIASTEKRTMRDQMDRSVAA